jgi:hypothetical protein
MWASDAGCVRSVGSRHCFLACLFFGRCKADFDLDRGLDRGFERFLDLDVDVVEPLLGTLDRRARVPPTSTLPYVSLGLLPTNQPVK